MHVARGSQRLLAGVVLFTLVILQPVNWGVSAFDAAPSLTALMPPQALAGTSTAPLSLSGADFQPDAVAAWSRDGTPSDMLTTFVSATELSAELPAEAMQLAGTIQISVRNSDGQVSNELAFTVKNPAPVLDTLMPDHALTGDPDTVLTLTGSGFTAGSTALWNDILLATTYVSGAELQATLSATLLVRDVSATITVQNREPGGRVSGGLSFAVQPHSNVWLPHSPEGGEVHALELDPADPAVAYAGTDVAAVFKSTDGGQSWAASSDGIWPGLRTFCIAVAPSDTATVLAGTEQGSWISHDAGSTWTRSLADPSLSAAFDPGNSEVAYVGTTHGLFATQDGGLTWQDVGKNPGNQVLQVVVTSPGTLYELDAPTDLTHTVWRTTDGAATWTEMTNGLPDSLVNAIGADPTNPQVLYAATWGYSSSPDTGIYKTADGGASWQRLLAENHFYRQIAVNKEDPQRVYVATEDGLLSSRDAGATWSYVVLNRREINTLAVDTAHAGRLLGAGERGVSVSIDEGATWSPANTGLTAQQVVDLAYAAPTQRLYAATYQGGMWSSSDFGSSWSHLSLDTKYLSQVLIDPNDPHRLLVASSFGNFETSDDGQTWTPFGALGIRNNAFASNSNVLYSPGWYGSDDGIIYGGSSNPQKIMPACGRPCHVDQIVPDPLDASTIYAVVSIYASETRYLYATHDGGATWQDIGGDRLDPSSYGFLAIDPLDTSVLYLAALSGLYKSTDRAATWQSLGMGPGWVTDMQVDPLNDQVIYTAGSGIHRSLDGGNTWLTIGPSAMIPEAVWAVQPIPPPTIASSEMAMTATSPSRARVVSGAGNGVYAYFSANEAPTALMLSSTLIADRMPAGTTVGTLATTDPNAGDRFKYALVRGAGDGNNSAFRISGNKLLTAKVLSRSVRSTYSVRVRSTDTGGLFIDSPFTITVTSTVPSLLTPSQSAQLTYNRPLFDWSDVGSVTGYTIQVAPNTAFSSLTVSANVAASRYLPPKGLPPAKVLYWRVRANFPTGPGPWSAVRHVHTANPPATPVLISPANGTAVGTLTPQLTWGKVSVPMGTSFDHYEIQLANDAAFKLNLTGADVIGVASTRFRPDAPLLATTLYYWRVRSFNTARQYSDWSSARSFWTGP